MRRELELSASRIKLEEACPRAYWLSYHVERQDNGNIFAHVGTCVHAAIEKLLGLIKDGSKILEEHADPSRDIMVDAYRRRWIEFGYIPAGDNYQGGLDCIDNWLKYWFDGRLPQQNEVVGVEHEILEDVAAGNGLTIKFHGFIDFIQSKGGSIIVHDWKSGHRIDGYDELCQDPQCALYAMFAAEMFPNVDEITTVWHYLRHNARVTITWKRDTLNGVKDWLIERATDLDERVRGGEREFPPQANTYCAYRNCMKDCPVFKKETPDCAPEDYDCYTTAEQYQKACAYAKAWDDRKKTLYGKMKRFLDTGPFEHMGRRWELGTTTRTQITPLGAVDIANYAGVDFTKLLPALNVSVTRLKEVLSWLPKNEKELARKAFRANTTEVKTSRLSSKKI